MLVNGVIFTLLMYLYILPFKNAFGCFKGVVVYLSSIWLFSGYLAFLRVDLAFFANDYLATLLASRMRLFEPLHAAL